MSKYRRFGMGALIGRCQVIIPDSSGGGGTNSRYVDPASGNDANDGLTLGTAWKTLDHAALTLVAGQTCYVSSGTITTRCNITTSGNEGQLISYIATGSVLTKGFTITASYIHVEGFEVTETDGSSFAGKVGFHIVGTHVEIINNYIHQVYGEGIRLGMDHVDPATSYCLIQNNRIYRAGNNGIQVMGQNHTIEGNEIWGTVQWSVTWPAYGYDANGLSFYGYNHLIKGNYIHDILSTDAENGNSPHMDCLQTFGIAQNITFDGNLLAIGEPLVADKQALQMTRVNLPCDTFTFKNNIIRDCYRGFNFDGSYNDAYLDYIYVENNTFANLTEDPVEFQHCTNSRCQNNIFYNCAGQLYRDAETTANSFTVGYNCSYNQSGLYIGSADPNDLWNINPVFANAAGNDFHLQATSPCINAGVAIPGLINDYDDSARPQGGQYDIGAFEGVGGQQSNTLYLINLETGNTSQFSVVYANSNTVEASAAAKKNGNYGLRYVGLNAGNFLGYGQRNFGVTKSDISLSFYIYVDPVMDLGGINKFFDVATIFGNNGNYWLAKFGFSSPGTGNVPTRWSADCRIAGSALNQTFTTNFSLGAWHFIEIHWKQNATLGGFEVKVDGTVAYSNFTQDTSAYPADMTLHGCTGLTSGATATNKYVWLDDIWVTYV